MTEFKLPDIGEGIVECEVVEWRVQEGDEIAEDQPVVEVMTDKALVEITAPATGRVTRLHVAKGETARVHEPLFAYESGDDEAAGDTRDRHDADVPSQQEVASGAPASPAAEGPAREFILPDIGEGIVECEIVEWRIQEGDTIDEDQPVVDVMTDKAMVEITAPASGRVSRLHVAQGEIARVHEPLFAYIPDADDTEAAQAPERKAGATRAEHAAAPSRAAGPSPSERRDDGGRGKGQGAYGRIPASPAVRRLLREHDLRLEQVPGSGKDGRVLKGDVLAYLETGGDEATAGAAATAPGTDEVRAETRIEPLRGVRAAMARRMVESASTIPHFQYGEEIDVTELLALRERLKPRAEASETRLTLMPFFMKALALAVEAYPILNSRLDAEAEEIHYLPHCNVGMAVDGKAGLMVPNVKRVEHRSLLEIAGEVQRLTADARDGRVTQSDLRDGTISISNIGALGGTYAAPIINAPEVAIVAIGKTQWLPRFDDKGDVVSRAIMTATWAGDHRLIDGGTIARFCNVWKGFLENPETMLLELR
ncbi:dihydrolipoyllysine-residue acetyltransferase [Halomonas sp. I1]|uniref:dihydrolipoyllysine-residue acetyltransferase n=1 Tax=Halomonas sp. I1 TaxID=393536 RepID=UPI0028DF5D50|nr:dihydrolipoyllysine-residue acetyltransferase [Halomonas sp. I1]MDT8893955.1 dihydrolipoyllysine-residue acetyltransferase [Halomonas sp. I1]